MILRRANRIDPRFVLGSALAFALPLGANLAALAQNAAGPAPSPSAPAAQAPAAQAPAAGLDALRQRDQELDATRAQQRAVLEAQTKLKLEIDTISSSLTPPRGSATSRAVSMPSKRG